MSQVPKSECPAYTSVTGAVINVEPKKGVLLAASTTYFFLVSTPDASCESIHLVWDANIVITSINFEDSNLPRYVGQPSSPGVADDADISLVKGYWIQENPSTSYIPVTSTDGTTGGATVTNATIAVAGGTAGGAMLNIGNMGSNRGRIKVVVGATGGYFRCIPFGKTGA